ncbi:MAG TPA: serine/threonine-protein kinase, partial [Gemmatales bacterium]|nr:serine/threonine-protein kinase [Gemmatales bacterium]
GNIIRCYQVGKEQGLEYLAMEFVDGCSLQDLIDKHGKFSVGDALYVTLRVADALQYAHDLNLVHRDIKPDNVLITRKGVVKVADLGLAKPVNDDLSMTASGVGAGTPHYMAPEQMRSAK